MFSLCVYVAMGGGLARQSIGLASGRIPPLGPSFSRMSLQLKLLGMGRSVGGGTANWGHTPNYVTIVETLNRNISETEALGRPGSQESYDTMPVPNTQFGKQADSETEVTD